MRRLLPCFAVACVFLTGCSYVSDVGDFFTKDGDKDETKEIVATLAKTAGENSDDPEAAVTDLALKEGSAKLSENLSLEF